eukprot:200767-Amphidinium_carterae.1
MEMWRQSHMSPLGPLGVVNDRRYKPQHTEYSSTRCFLFFACWCLLWLCKFGTPQVNWAFGSQALGSIAYELDLGSGSKLDGAHNWCFACVDQCMCD